jgi:hypothetical protein
LLEPRALERPITEDSMISLPVTTLLRAWQIAVRLAPLVAIALTLAAGQRWR